MPRELPLPQRALEMHRRTGQPLDDCLFACACQDAIERPDLPPVEGRHWEPRPATTRMTGAERNG